MNGYNLTADQINQLSDQEARDLFARAAAQLCGTDRWVTDLAAQLGVERRTVQMWKGGDRRVPTLAVVAVLALVRSQELDGAVSRYVEAQEALAQLCGQHSAS